MTDTTDLRKLLIMNQASYIKGIYGGIKTVIDALKKAAPDDDWSLVEATVVQSATEYYQENMPEAYKLFRLSQQYAEHRMQTWPKTDA